LAGKVKDRKVEFDGFELKSTLLVNRDRYGGLRGYLDSIGFGPEAQRRLASCLADVPRRAPL
jgi:hypothetical protein